VAAACFAPDGKGRTGAVERGREGEMGKTASMAQGEMTYVSLLT